MEQNLQIQDVVATFFLAYNLFINSQSVMFSIIQEQPYKMLYILEWPDEHQYYKFWTCPRESYIFTD